MLRNRLVITLAIPCVLLSVLWLALAGSATAGAACSNSYIVQRGDTLSGIARRFGVPLQRLIQINRITHPDYIRVQQVLCLTLVSVPGDGVTSTPPPDPVTPTLPGEVNPENAPRLVLEASYIFTPTGDDALLTLATFGRLGKRVEYPLVGLDATKTVTDKNELLREVSNGNLPLLWLARRGRDHVLVSSGPQEPLASLRISATTPISPFALPPDPLSCNLINVERIGDPVPDLRLTNLTLVLETPDNLRYPFTITKIAHITATSQIPECFGEQPYLALFTIENSNESGYRTVLVIMRDDGSPGPGAGAQAQCRQLKRGGWWSRFWYAWRGCV